LEFYQKTIKLTKPRKKIFSFKISSILYKEFLGSLKPYPTRKSKKESLLPFSRTRKPTQEGRRKTEKKQKRQEGKPTAFFKDKGAYARRGEGKRKRKK
jgi:hypothetical protein